MATDWDTVRVKWAEWLASLAKRGAETRFTVSHEYETEYMELLTVSRATLNNQPVLEFTVSQAEMPDPEFPEDGDGWSRCAKHLSRQHVAALHAFLGEWLVTDNPIPDPDVRIFCEALGA